MSEHGFLYHYTSIGTLIEIAKSRVIWASNVHYLNDGTEFQYGLNLLRGMLDEFTLLQPHSRKYIGIIKAVITSFERMNVFVASFSAEGDVLSQWRAYCPPGQGVSVGIEPNDLKRAAEAQGFAVHRCVYDRRDQAELVKVLVAEALGIDSGTDEITQTSLAHQFVARFTRIAATLKDPSFSEESEWRVVSNPLPVDHPQVQYRAGRSTIVPYFEFKLPVDSKGRLQLGHFIVGPTPFGDLSISAVSSMCAKYNVAWVGTKPSAVPYRSW